MKEEPSIGALICEFAREYERARRAHVLQGEFASPIERNILCELLRSNGSTQQVLTERLGVDKGWISRAIEPLIRDGSISKTASEFDRRSAHIGLTRSGRIRARKIDNSLTEHVERFLVDLSDEKKEMIERSLRLLITAIRASEKQ